jgi:hypothetical protein
MGIPLPPLTPLFLIVVETVRAVAFIVGLALPLVAVAFTVDRSARSSTCTSITGSPARVGTSWSRRRPRWPSGSTVAGFR